MLATLALIGAALLPEPTHGTAPLPNRGNCRQAAIDRGTSLAAIGNCIGCHTVDGGPP